MQLTNIFAAALLSTAALASPIEPRDVSMAAANNAQWTIRSFRRVCNAADTSCNVSFGINRNDGSAVTNCAYTINGNPADRTSSNGVVCGAYTVSSGWSGQFGAGNGFTTFAVTDQKQIIYPAYTDKELASGNTVSPDKSYPVNNLPGR